MARLTPAPSEAGVIAPEIVWVVVPPPPDPEPPEPEPLFELSLPWPPPHAARSSAAMKAMDRARVVMGYSTLDTIAASPDFALSVPGSNCQPDRRLSELRVSEEASVELRRGLEQHWRH